MKTGIAIISLGCFKLFFLLFRGLRKRSFQGKRKRKLGFRTPRKFIDQKCKAVKKWKAEIQNYSKK